MKFLLLNQTFYPDVVATGQYLTEVATALVDRGHEVTVITGRRAYDNPEKLFPKRETWRGVRIIRIGSAGLGKSAKWKRAVDFASFSAACAFRLAFLPRHDAIIALTSPPLISFLGAAVAKLRGSEFFYWVMDFNPDEAIAAGWLRADTLAAKVLDAMSRFSLRRAKKIFALDRFMRDRIAAKKIAAEKIAVIPPWSHDGEVHFDASGREVFRKKHGVTGKFVVMYSGNHSPCHPLGTVLDAAKHLATDPDVAFLFVGGGSQFPKVKQFAREHSLANIICLPYQPFDQIAGSLSAADLHLVIMGNPFVGLVHPCKIYNILKVGSPVLYIGPQPSHVSEILSQIGSNQSWAMAEHGRLEQVVQAIVRLKNQNSARSGDRPLPPVEQYSKNVLLHQMIAALEETHSGSERVSRIHSPLPTEKST